MNESITENTLIFMPKRSQEGGNIDAETHQTAMPKLAPKMIRTIITNYVFPIGKITVPQGEPESQQVNIEHHTKVLFEIGVQSIQISCSTKRYKQTKTINNCLHKFIPNR